MRVKYLLKLTPGNLFLLFLIQRKSLFHSSVNEHDDFLEETKNIIPNDATKLELDLFVN